MALLSELFLLASTIQRNHGCEIVKVEFFIQRFKKIGCFLTVTKDGVLQFWSESFSLISSYMVSGVVHVEHMWGHWRASALAPQH